MTTNNTQQRILETAAALFANKGYDALTMRDIATACNIKAPSLYNHFKDKQQLYLATLRFVFTREGDALMACLQSDLPAQQKLDDFIALACRQMAGSFIFRQLFIRELLGQDEDRLKFLANEVMLDNCLALQKVFVDINPDCDPHFLTTSLMSLLFFHFQSNALRLHLPGGSEETQSIDYLTKNIQQMINHHLNC
ncbi:TetR/AcrR family transcriptional regulator [Hydrogenovibrio kuenenii]|uniref:TetR/AcrR family transcriptional regulator n=1 Tax=Hydrogenovibrio kuenenii TaxID=63658 RepID=UPI0004ADA88E|nr:TetR/AcrR family transcriptional regulator [Hydrogenovibrio kuenenii]